MEQTKRSVLETTKHHEEMFVYHVIPVTWKMYGHVRVKVPLNSTREQVEEAVCDADLPHGEYLDDSFEIQNDDISRDYYKVLEKIGKAFLTLSSDHEIFGVTDQPDNSSSIGEGEEKMATDQYNGFVFIHDQNIGRLLNGQNVEIGFAGKNNARESQIKMVGALLVQALQNAGLRTKWDGTVGQKVTVLVRDE